jgi:hypothetical protein
VRSAAKASFRCNIDTQSVEATYSLQAAMMMQ